MINTKFLNKILISSVLVFVIIFINSCKCDNKKTETTEVSSKSEDIFEIKRYDRAIFNIPKDSLVSSISKIENDYKFFLGDNWQDASNLNKLTNYLNDKMVLELQAKTQETYPDLTFLEKGLQQALQNFVKLFPDKPFPKVYTYVSGIDVEHPVMYFDTVLIIGLDVFLGANEKLYQEAGVPNYISSRFTKEHILPKSMEAIADYLISYDDKNNNLLSMMIAMGKILYFEENVLPNTSKNLIIGYSEQQYKWAIDNQKNIWAVLIGNNFLYSSDKQVITRSMADGPFTKGFSKEAPARLGAFIGWQIVKSYMNNNKNVTIKELFADTDAAKILKLSGYKP